LQKNTSPRPGLSWQRFAIGAIGIIAVLGAGAAVFGLRTRAAAARLPDVPDLTSRPPLLVEQVQLADRQARRSPTKAVVVGTLAMTYHADLFYDQAIAAYRLAAEMDPAEWRWPYCRSMVHMERGQLDEAADSLAGVVRLRPDLGLAWWRLGESEFKRANYDAAEAAYARAEASGLGEEPSVATYARVGRARVVFNQGNRQPAIAILEAIVRTAPRFGVAHRVLADVYRADGRTADADRHGARGAALRAYAGPADPQMDALADLSRSSIFLLRSASSLDLARQAPRREQLVRRALESDSTNPDVVYEMGALLQQLRRPADALPYFTRHLDLVDDDRQTLVQLGKVYADLGRDDDAETTIKQALALGDDAVGFYNLGILMERRDRIGEAETAYRKAIALGPGLASARNNLGALLAARGQLNNAARELLESIRLDPSAPDAYTNLAAVRLQQGNDSEAARYARLAIELEPRQADAHANLAVALAQQGNIDAAQREFEAALAINPRHVNARRNLELLKRARD
jgi:tetratricopeptide (TPR) repeat protein